MLLFTRPRTRQRESRRRQEWGAFFFAPTKQHRTEKEGPGRREEGALTSGVEAG
jgi:hypothetical protein